MVVIRAKRFILRPFRKGDEKSLMENISNKIIAKNTLRIPYPYKLKDARWWINHNLKLDKKKQKHEINFAIEIDDEAVGGIGLDRIWQHCAEIGYWLGEKYWGQGIMTTAIRLVTEYGFKKLGLRRIYAFVFLWNKFLDDFLFAKVK